MSNEQFDKLIEKLEELRSSSFGVMALLLAILLFQAATCANVVG